MNITQLNHVALHCDDLDASARFYRQVLGLEPMARPAFAFPGVWFRIGIDQELHLIARPPSDPQGYSIPRERHFALRVTDIDQAAQQLTDLGVPFDAPKRRPDGAMQIFLRDPDDHVIELCSMAESSG